MQHVETAVTVFTYPKLHIQVGHQQLAGSTASLSSHGIELSLRLSLLLSCFPSKVLFCLQQCSVAKANALDRHVCHLMV